MANDTSVLTKMLLKSVMPTVTKFVESGKIDSLFREIKTRFSESMMLPEDSTEILITTEADGLEYVNVVEMTQDHCIVQVMHQQRLSQLINELFTQAEL